MKLRIFTFLTLIFSNLSLFAQTEEVASTTSALGMVFNGRPLFKSFFFGVLVVLLFAIYVAVSVYRSAKAK